MKKLIVTFLIAVVVIAQIANTSVLAGSVFSDIGSSPYKADIEYLQKNGIVAGYGDGTFRPLNSVSRAEMMKVVVEALGGADEADYNGKKDCFSDLKDAWFSPYVCYAKEHGIVSGYKDGRFRPGQKVNMAEAEKIAIEAFGFTAEGVKTGSQWYVPYLNFVHNNNIFSKHAYLPGREMKRGEMAHLLHKLILLDNGTNQPSSKRDARSTGCGKAPPRMPPTSSLVSNVVRDYITVIPRGYEKNTPIKLVFAFHGRTNPNTMVRTYYKVEEASAGKAIFIYPAGMPAGRGSRNWSNSGDSPDELRDFTLFDQLLEEFSENYCIDMDSIYVVGHSLGAWFTNSLACARGDVIRAIGSVGGGAAISDCSGPTAAMIWHNPKDNLTPFSQGLIARDQLNKQNACSDATVEVAPRGAAQCVSYTGCGIYSPLVWCPHTFDYASWDGSYYPHTWPGIAGKEIWKFFEGLEK